MKARVRRMRDVDCVVIDYLQLMQSGKRNGNRVQEVSDITRNLKLMAKDVTFRLSRLPSSRAARRDAANHTARSFLTCVNPAPSSRMRILL